MEQTVQTTQPEVTQPTSALFTTLMALVENHIRDIVTTQVNEILLNHRTLRLIDEGFKEQIKQIARDVAEDAVSDHNDAEYHLSESHIDDKIESEVESRLHDHDFSGEIHDTVREVVGELTFSVTVD